MNRTPSSARQAAFLATILALASAGVLRAQQTAQESSGGLRLIDTSVNVIVAGGASSEDNHVLEELQGGGHDPKRNGFTLQQAEVSFSGVIDPYFRGEAHIVFTEDDVELEEAFVTSTALPSGLELKAGYFLTEFGRINPTHPHTWHWMDQPIVASRLLGEDGLRAPGVRLAWLLPTRWYSQLYFGIQNADSETAISFLGEGHHHGEEDHGHAHGDEEEEHEDEHEEEDEHGHEMEGETTIAGRPRVERELKNLDEYLYLVRWENSADLTEQSTVLFGLSGLYGPNDASENGETYVYGADLTLKWRPENNKRGYPFVIWQSEIMKRDFKAGAVSIPHDEHFHDFASETIKDWGFYSQLVWGFAPRWETGLRVEYVTGNDAGVEERDHDPARSDRVRISPMLAYRPSEFTRVRVQYNYDDADFLDDKVHTVWAGLELLFGKHPAHKF
ncbi:MAG TPA: hypothetical protein PKE12_01680 [Kiritimatiellia bacterium]|nr:hypothetical protein [Kiritimatiellia bacterium]